MADGRYLPQLDVRCSPSVAERVGAALGVPLPTTPNTVRSNGQRSILWLAPDEWLVVDEGSAAATEREVRAAFAPDWGAVTDVSANRVLFELSGPGARDTLARG